jgi:hypothetical protein
MAPATRAIKEASRSNATRRWLVFELDLNFAAECAVTVIEQPLNVFRRRNDKCYKSLNEFR